MFGSHLRQLRHRADLTQEALAEQVGCAVATLRAIENGRRRPSLPMAIRFADVLGVTGEERESFLRLARSNAAEAPPSAEAPPIKRISSPDQPPPHATPLIGRERELAAIRRQLSDRTCRLLTLVGPGGIGKTRLAYEAAHLSGAAYADGVRLVWLAGAADSNTALRNIAHVLGVAVGADSDPAPLISALRERNLLLVLDNLEHLIGDDTLVSMVSSLITQAPGVQILATSRSRLNLRAERTITLHGLAGTHASEPPGDGVLLFVERARRRQADFTLSAHNRPAIDTICRLVEGSPLAIELAAAWVPTLTPHEIAVEIARDLDLLTRADRDAPAGHRSMRAVFERSWRLLSGEEQRALTRLAIFRGGATREAVEFVAEMRLHQIAGLINHSLLRYDGARYVQHEVIRRYAAEQLPDADSDARAEQRFLNYYLALAAEAMSTFNQTGARDRIDTLAVEHDNLREALRLAAAGGLYGAGANLCVLLRQFWVFHGHMPEGIAWAEQFLTRLPAGSPERGHLINTLAHMLRLSSLAERAQALSNEAVAIFRNVDDPQGLAEALFNQGQSAIDMGDYALALTTLAESQIVHRQLGNLHRAALLYASLADVAWLTGNLDEAEQLFELAYAAGAEHDNHYMMAGARWSIGFARTLRSDPTALELIYEGLTVFRAYGYVLALAQTLELFAAQAGQRERHAEGAQLLGAAVGLREARNVPFTLRQRELTAPLWRMARGPLNDAAFNTAFDAGKRLSFEAALALAETIWKSA